MEFAPIIEKVAFNLLKYAATVLPDNAIQAIKTAHEDETNPVGKSQLEAIIKNFEAGSKLSIPMCQDTGIHIYYVEIGADSPINDIGKIKEALSNASKRATTEVPMRPNAVDPFGSNSGDNTGRYIPWINWEIVPGDKIKITAFPKGGGSENMSTVKMLKPGVGIKGVMKEVLDWMIQAGGQPCPPTVVGVAVGGGADIAMKLAKKQLMRPIGDPHPQKEVAEIEKKLKEAINATGIGPMGLGGKITCLAVHMDYAHRHPASLPMAIAVQCWAARQSAAEIGADGKVKYLHHKIKD
ncbi:MAG: fumarate hydratase [Candidatus Heimdallarchaeota archaeon]|nr:fumarate hydratase [Candidatus Heimdallarchaeota archaeon]MBY8993251.1 fumarate hydratase [Candidatus Heimdallarchaeota archaeon]